MPCPMIGELAAIGASTSWSIGISCVAKASRRMGVLAANHVRIILGVLILVLARLFLSDTIFPVLSQQAWLMLALSGVAGFFLADYFLLKSCVTLSTREAFLLFSLSPIISVGLGWTFLNEHLSPISCLGIAITLSGICLVILEKKEGETQRHKNLLKGILFGVLAAFWQAVGAALAKRGMIGAGTADPLSANLIRALFAGAAYILVGLVQGRTFAIIRQIRNNPKSVGLISIASVVGLAFGTWLFMVALKMAPIGIATTLASTMPVTVLPFAILIDHETISKRAILGAVIACVGVGVLMAF